MRHVYECQMRRADQHGDSISNVAFVDYLQEARLDLLRHHNTSPTPNPGEGLVVVHTVVDYLAPLRLVDAPLSVSVWSGRAGDKERAREEFDWASILDAHRQVFNRLHPAGR